MGRRTIVSGSRANSGPGPGRRSAITDGAYQVAPILHLAVPKEHVVFQVAVEWPADIPLAELERDLVDLGYLPLPGDRVDRLIVRIGTASGLWRFSARADWRAHRCSL